MSSLPIQTFAQIGGMFVGNPSLGCFALGFISTIHALERYRDLSGLFNALPKDNVQSIKFEDQEKHYVLLKGRISAEKEGCFDLGCGTLRHDVVGTVEVTRTDYVSAQRFVPGPLWNTVHHDRNPTEYKAEATFAAKGCQLSLDTGEVVEINDLEVIDVRGQQETSEDSAEVYGRYHSHSAFSRLMRSSNGQYRAEVNYIPEGSEVCVVGVLTKNQNGEYLLSKPEDSRAFFVTMQKVEEFLDEKKKASLFYGVCAGGLFALSTYYRWFKLT